jgi:hypothetical protein
LLRIGSTFKGRIWIPFKLMALDPDPDPDPHQYADDKMQCCGSPSLLCGSASLSCGSGSDLSLCCGSRSWFLFDNESTLSFTLSDRNWLQIYLPKAVLPSHWIL